MAKLTINARKTANPSRAATPRRPVTISPAQQKKRLMSGVPGIIPMAIKQERQGRVTTTAPTRAGGLNNAPRKIGATERAALIAAAQKRPTTPKGLERISTLKGLKRTPTTPKGRREIAYRQG